LPLAVDRLAVASSGDRPAVALRNGGICCPRSPRFPAALNRFCLRFYDPLAVLLCSTISHFVPLFATS